MNLTPITPYWSRCGNCGEVSYTPTDTAQPAATSPASGLGGRRLYSEETVPLPVSRDPRRRLIGIGLGFAGAALYAVSAALAPYILAVSLGVTFIEVLFLPESSLIATLWIFVSVAFAVMGFYSAVLVLRKKVQIGAGWITGGALGISLAAIFLFLTDLVGAWLGLAAGLLILAAGLLNTLSASMLRALGLTSRAGKGR